MSIIQFGIYIVIAYFALRGIWAFALLANKWSTEEQEREDRIKRALPDAKRTLQEMREFERTLQEMREFNADFFESAPIDITPRPKQIAKQEPIMPPLTEGAFPRLF